MRRHLRWIAPAVLLLAAGTCAEISWRAVAGRTWCWTTAAT